MINEQYIYTHTNIKSMLKVELKEILLTKDTQKKNPSQPKLTHQICYSGHETKITLEKANKKKTTQFNPY